MAAFECCSPNFELLFSAEEPGILRDVTQRMGYELFMEKYTLLLHTISEVDDISDTARMPKMVSSGFHHTCQA